MKFSFKDPFWIVVSIVYLLILGYLLQGLDTPYLWYDEAGQFFIAKGQNHYSSPNSAVGGVLAVISNNSHFNMDPGGFGILLHFWSDISNSHIWLRTLPLFFFIGTSIAFVKLSIVLLGNTRISILAGFIPILWPIALSQAFEIRAYSMEMFGTIVGLIAIFSLRKYLNYKNILIWSILLSIIITSRYSSVVVIFVYSLFVLYIIIKSSWGFKQKIIGIILYSIPLLITVAFIYFYSMKIQNKDAKALAYLPYLNGSFSILWDGFTNKLYTTGLLILVFLLFLRNKLNAINKNSFLIIITLLIHFVFLILSFKNMHPWATFSSRCISMQLLLIFTYWIIIINTLKDRKKIHWFLLSINTMLIVCLCLVTNMMYHTDYFLRKQSNWGKVSNVYLKLFVNKTYGSVYISAHELPSARYLFEYGILKDKTTYYPQNFHYGVGEYHNISLFQKNRNSELKDVIYKKYDLNLSESLERSGVFKSINSR